MKLAWSLLSRADLQNIYVYIAERNPKAARKVVERIRERARQLRDFNLGRPGRVPDRFELVIPEYPYIIVYSLREKVFIPRVWPTKRLWPKSF
jgi:plasmid stabilization system protein ParE